MNPEVSVLVVAHDNENDLPRCLQSIGEHIGVAHETIVVDNASSDNGPDLVRSRHPGVRLLEPGSNLGFAAGNALAARHATLTLS